MTPGGDGGTMGGALADGPEYRRWRGEAGRALEGAVVQGEVGLFNWACFLAEQAAQLAVKGLLHGLGLGAWGHDLVRLGAAVQEAGIDLSDDVDASTRRLSRHYIPARYPDAHPSGPPGEHYGANDAAEAIKDARLILRFVDSTWEAL